MIQWYRDKVVKAPKRSRFWRKFVRTLKDKHPYCSACGSRRLLAGHHVIPFHINPRLELDKKNVVILCFWCHFVLGHLRNWKSWNKDVLQDANILLNKIVNRP